MDRFISMDSNSSGPSMQPLNNVAISNNTSVNKENHMMDLKKLSSRVIFSDNITRHNFSRKASLDPPLIADEDDDQFLEKLKSKIDKNLSHCKENYNPLIRYQGNSITRKRKSVIDEATENVIKRFKCDTNRSNSVQLLSNTDMQTNTLSTSDILNTNFRIPSSKYIFEVTSKMQTNTVDETTIFHQQYEESLLYEMMFLTPPDCNTIEDGSDS
ncbi:uncharacterized protein LOC143422159 [Xylocopa sonorina]|uniref:uncharacterized protein LOC143422159 n=1 Tax=Xylocopa sonorina TaxID=1818115 RepID=UPI00403AE899